MDEKWTLSALWIMFHDLMDFTLGSPQTGEPKVKATWSPLNHEIKKPWLVQKIIINIFLYAINCAPIPVAIHLIKIA